MREALTAKLTAAFAAAPLRPEVHHFYVPLRRVYVEVLAELGRAGCAVQTTHGDDEGDQNWIDGLELMLPTGERVPIPDPFDEFDGEKTALTEVARVVDFFLGLPRFAVYELPTKVEPMTWSPWHYANGEQRASHAGLEIILRQTPVGLEPSVSLSATIRYTDNCVPDGEPGRSRAEAFAIRTIDYEIARLISVRAALTRTAQ